jgi:hypothetical protein
MLLLGMAAATVRACPLLHLHAVLNNCLILIAIIIM